MTGKIKKTSSLASIKSKGSSHEGGPKSPIKFKK
jgi:hypothetical protein